MLVFLSPKIIRSSKDHKDVFDKKMDERLSFIKAQGGRDPFGSRLDKLTKKNSSEASSVDKAESDTESELELDNTIE
jgi:hypothetical protein